MSLVEARALYRNLLKASMRFQDYNFRSYFVRRTKEEFRRGELTSESLALGKSQLEVLQRQATLQSLYPSPKSILETPRAS